MSAALESTRNGILTQVELKELLHYAPDTGGFLWRKGRSNVVAGTRAGTPDKDGYVIIRIDKRHYRAHRLAWFYVIGVWPRAIIDHINRNPFDNRFCNLREATHSQNQHNRSMQANNTTG